MRVPCLALLSSWLAGCLACLACLACLPTFLPGSLCFGYGAMHSDDERVVRLNRYKAALHKEVQAWLACKEDTCP